MPQIPDECLQLGCAFVPSLVCSSRKPAEVLPGQRGSMWRMLADPAPGGHGVGVSEILFFRAVEKTERAGKVFFGSEVWQLGFSWYGS